MALSNEPMCAIEVLKYVTYIDCFPVKSTAYRFLFIVPMILASTEKEFIN